MKSHPYPLSSFSASHCLPSLSLDSLRRPFFLRLSSTVALRLLHIIPPIYQVFSNPKSITVIPFPDSFDSCAFLAENDHFLQPPHTCLTFSVVENEFFEQSRLFAKGSLPILKWTTRHHPTGQSSKLVERLLPSLKASVLNSSWTKRRDSSIAFALDTGGIPSNGDQESSNGDNRGLGGTRLGRIVSAGGRQLLEKLNSARKNFPMKVFLLLLGFYTANALATILGQTGDWDVLVAGVVVAAIEGIGMLMYRKPPSLPTGRLQSLVGMVNYWKAGVCLGLFVDAFKLGS